MATIDTPTKLPLVTQFSGRNSSLTKGPRLVNCFAEKDLNTGEYWVQKRIGMVKSSYPVVGGRGRGIFTSAAGHVYYVFGSVLYMEGIVLGAVHASNNMYHFEALPNTVVLGDGISAYYVTDGLVMAPVQIVDPNFPTFFVQGWAYLDHTLYVMDTSNNILGSKNFDDPAVWDPLNSIQASSTPYKGIKIIRQLEYILAIKQTGIEYFWDAGNPTGSPLSKVPEAFSPIGCCSTDSVQEIDGMIFMLSYNKTVSPQIMMIHNLVPSPVSTPSIERILDTIFNVFPPPVLSFTFKHNGHRFYVLTVLTAAPTVGAAYFPITMVYDIDQKIWSFWTDSEGNYFPFLSQAYTLNGIHLFQHETNGTIYAVDSDSVYPNDDGVFFPVDIYTDNFTGGLRRRIKFLNSMGFEADQTLGSVLQVRSSDDDYQTWTNFKTVDLGVETPELNDEGSFYRRAYHFRHQANTPFRIKAVDLELDLGTK